MQALITDNNELSDFSEPVDVTTAEALPTEPTNLRSSKLTVIGG